MRNARITLLIITLGLILFGLCAIYTTTYSMEINGEALGSKTLIKQIQWLTVGTLSGIVLWFYDYRKMGRISYYLLGGVTLLLIYLFIADITCERMTDGSISAMKQFARVFPLYNGPVNGSSRWLTILGRTVQPSEFAKVFLIMTAAFYLGKNYRHMSEFKRGFVKPAFVSGVVLFFILAGKDLSTTVVTGAILFAMSFIGGMRLRYLFLILFAGIFCFILILIAFPERMRRVTTFMEHEKYRSGETMQLHRSILALGAGGTTGQGLGNSRLKKAYLPENHTDFIVSIIGEELGFVSVLSLILVYITLTVIIFMIGIYSRTRHGMLICSGVGLYIGTQSFINISVVSGLLPTTGVTAPLISYGGSSAISTLMMIGLVLNVSWYSEKNDGTSALGDQEFDNKIKSSIHYGGIEGC